MLVKRAGGLRVVAHGIEIAHLETPAGALQATGLFAETVVSFIRVSPHEMMIAMVATPDHIGVLGAVAGDFLPGFAGSRPAFPNEGKRGIDGQAQLFRFQDKPAVLLIQHEVGAGKACEVVPRTAVERHVAFRCDGPGPVQTIGPVLQQNNADERIFENLDHQAVPVLDFKCDPGAGAAQVTPVFEGFHDRS